MDVELHLPRTPGNIALGNFMLDLELLSSAARPSPTSYPLHPDAAIEVKNESKILAKSSRPATLTYYSQVVDHVNMAAALPLYTLGWKLEAEKLDVRMMEGVEFKRGWRNIPKGLKLEVRTDARNGGQFQIYGCKIKFMARFRGLRYVSYTKRSFLHKTTKSPGWTYFDRRINVLIFSRSFMYKHRIVSFILFTTTFWIVSTTTTLLVYFALAYALFPSTPPSVPMKHERLTTDPIKHEPDGISDIEAPSFSDTSRTFPTLRQQEPLHFSATSPRIKTEPGERDRDSGIGSSLPEDAAPGPSSLSAARAARRYPTPEVDGQEMQMLQRPGTPGEAADDEEEDADFVEDELAEGPVNGIGEEEHGFETRAGDVREGMRRRRSRLSTRAGEGGGP